MTTTGQVNQPSNLLDRVKRLERQYQRLWKSPSLSSATIAQGGLTLLTDAFLRMVDDNNDEIVYIGPDEQGKQIIRVRREGGTDVLYTYTAASGRQYWALTDNAGEIVIGDDADSGQGIARPWIPVPVQTVIFDHLPSTPSTTWEPLQTTGWRPKQHPFWEATITHSVTAPDTTGQARLLLDGAQVGPTIPVGWNSDWTYVGPFPVPGTHMSHHLLELQARRTAGTGRVGASMAVEARQT